MSIEASPTKPSNGSEHDEMRNRRKPRCRRCVWIAILAIASALGIGAAQAQTDQKLVLKVAASDRPDRAPLYLSLHRGYFARQGLAVELIPAATGADFLSGLGMNQIQAT